jgi:hypothetical protein
VAGSQHFADREAKHLGLCQCILYGAAT